MEIKTYTSTVEESTMVERVARIVSSVRGTKPDYTRLAAELEQAVPFDIFGVVLLRHDRQAVRVVVCQREGSRWQATHHQHPREDSMLDLVLRSPKLMVNEYPSGLDGPPSLCGDALSGYHQLHSTLIVPLAVEDRVLGTLELGSSVPHIYADSALQRLISAFVRVLASAIESAQLGGSAEIQDRQRQVLKNVSSALTEKMDLSLVLKQIVGGLALALEAASAIFILNRRDNRLSLEVQAAMENTVSEKLFHSGLPLSESCIISESIRLRQPISSPDIANDTRFPSSRLFATELGMRSILSYPLATGTTVYGAILLCSPDYGGFTPLKADILALFANQATIAIHNALLFEAAQHRRRFQEAVEQFERAHGQFVQPFADAEREDEQELLARVRSETQKTFGISFTSLLRFISDSLLTWGERDLQGILGTYSREQTLSTPTHLYNERSDPQAEMLSVLTQTAQTALLRAGMLSELSRLLLQLQQSTHGVKDAWFVVALNGSCVYMNPAAEAFCEMRLEEMSPTYGAPLISSIQLQRITLDLENIFARLFNRIRNAEEVRSYLRDFAHETHSCRELRCVLAAEPIIPLSPLAPHDEVWSSSSSTIASSDYHYQFIRHPLYDQQGQCIAFALQVHDVTEHVRDEKNRTALLSLVSHELRTPLTTIKAAVTGLLQTDVAWEEQDRHAMLEDIDAETDHLTRLVNALVEMSRIEMGALTLEKEWCDVVEIVHGALTKMERILEGHPVRVQVASHLPLVYADHMQLERVIFNLIENAGRQSPRNTEIVVSLDVAEEDPSLLHVQVLDQGNGVPQHEQERIFKSYNLRSYGNGLSLAICKGIVEAHLGRIGLVAAGVDGKSGFFFLLPIHPPKDELAGVQMPVGQPWRPDHRTMSPSAHELAGEEQL